LQRTSPAILSGRVRRDGPANFYYLQRFFFATFFFAFFFFAMSRLLSRNRVRCVIPQC